MNEEMRAVDKGRRTHGSGGGPARFRTKGGVPVVVGVMRGRAEVQGSGVPSGVWVVTRREAKGVRDAKAGH